MGGDLPKQFLVIAGKPILIHTIERVYSFDSDAQIILTLPEEWKSYWTELLTTFSCTIPHTIADGGNERYHSVKNAIKYCTGDYIAIHDGVRPLVNFETFERLKQAVIQYGAVVPVIPVKESIRTFENSNSRSLDRSKFKIVQTPQVFSREIIEKAYDQEYHQGITDDASLVEESGYKIQLVDGNDENIKITSPTDLIIAEALIKPSIQ
jgi:2-C-methyl-D-erythritol 4-phosphate cytidylyltransferase